MSQNLFSLIEAGAKASANAQKYISALLNDGDKSELTATAAKIEAKYDDKTLRNQRLSVLRVQLARSCKALELPKLTVKKVKGEWTLADATAKTVDEDAELVKKLEAALNLIGEHIDRDDVARAVATLFERTLQDEVSEDVEEEELAEAA